MIRGGKTTLLNVHELVVGDILHLEPGDLIPVDGVLTSGHNIKADESGATGESDAIKKIPVEYALSGTEPLSTTFNNKCDPLILSGSKILEGVGRYIVTAVGVNSYYGRTMICKFLRSNSVLTGSSSRRTRRYATAVKIESSCQYDCKTW